MGGIPGKPRMGRRKRQLLALVNRHGRISTGEIVIATGANESSVSTSLGRLESEGLIRRERRGVWMALRAQRGEQPNEGRPDNVIELPRHEKNEWTGVDLREVLSALVRWVAQYDGPTDDPMAVEVVLAQEHMKRAFEFAERKAQP